MPAVLFEINTGLFVGALIGVLIAGGVIGFFIARLVIKKQIEKNPPITEKMIRVMFAQMGRTPSEKQVREIMRNVNKQ